MRIALFLASLLMTCPALAQLSGSVNGRLLDTTQREVLEGATVRLLKIDGKDTVTVATTVTRSNATFSLNHLPMGDFLLAISYQGYRTWWGNIRLVERQPVMNRLRVYMQVAMAEMGPVVVRDERPVRMHGDTTVYQADQFHTRPNAAAGDLLQKMPGIDLLQTGTVMAHGDTVKQILVNGKRFFSNDLTVALKYLPRDLVAQIEVFDDKSDQAKFTGVDDGVRIRTINIVLKRSLKLGIFGQAGAGVGGDGNSTLYNGDLGLHRIKGNSMTSVIGHADNTSPVIGGTQKSASGGVNFSDHWGKNTNLSGSYQGNSHVQRSSVGSYTENLVPGDSSIYNTQQQNNQSRNQGHSVNFNAETDLDSADHFTLRGNGNLGSGSNSAQNVSSATKGLTVPLNATNGATADNSPTKSGGLSMLWGRRFKKQGRNFSLSVDLRGTNGTSTGTSEYRNDYFIPGRPDSTATANQYYSAPNKSANVAASLSFTEPLGKHSSLTLDYRYTYQRSHTGRATYQWDSSTHGYTALDTVLTNLFTDKYQTHAGGFRFQYGSRHLKATAGLRLQDGRNQNDNVSNGTALSQHYLDFSPLATLDYSPKNGKNLKLDYQGQTVQPSLNALQPVVNNSNPLNVVIGNPRLRQSFTHAITLSYRSFNKIDYSHIFANLRMDVLENQVTNKTSVNLSTGVDTTTYTNLNGNYSLNGNLDYGFRLKKSNMGVGLDLGDMHSVGYVNGVLNATSNYAIAGNIKWTSNFPDHLDLNVTYHPSYNIAVYSVETSRNTHYMVQDFHLNGLYYSTNGWELGSDLNYTGYSGRPKGFNPTTSVWNASLAHLFFKLKQGELKLSVHDMLNQSATVNEVITPTMIQNTYGRLLGRYYLLTFTYHLKGS